MNRTFEILLLLLLPVVSFTQGLVNPSFDQYKLKNLEIKSVHSQQWDDEGNLWFLYDNGFCKYNGNSYEKIEHEGNNPNSPLDAKIVNLFQDKDGFFWLGYMKPVGISKYNPETKNFTHYPSDTINKNGIPNAPIINFKEYNDDKLIIFSWEGGFSLFDKNTEKAELYFKSSETDTLGVKSNTIRDGVILPDGNILLCYFDEKAKSQPTIFNPKTKTFKPFPIEEYLDGVNEQEKEYIIKNSWIINFSYLDSEKNIWLGSYSSLMCINTTKKTINRIVTDSSELIRQNIVNPRDYEEDNNGLLWVTTYNSGVLQVNIKTLQAQYLKHDPHNYGSVGSSNLSSINMDPMGNLWIQTEGTNFSIYNPYFQNFNLDSWNEMDLKFLNTSAQIIPVRQMNVLPDGKVLLSNQNGMLQFNPFTKDAEILFLPKSNNKVPRSKKEIIKGLVNYFVLQDDKIIYDNKYSLSSYSTDKEEINFITKGRIFPIFGHKHHSIKDTLFFQKKGKLNYLDPTTNKLKVYDTINKFSRSVKKNCILNDGRWIVGANKQSFNIYDRRTKTLETFSSDQKEDHYYFPDSSFNVFYVQPESNIVWIGTQNGLYSFNTDTYQAVSVNDSIHINNEFVSAMTQDDNGIFWIALAHDIIKWDRKSNTSFRYTKEYGVKAGYFLPSVAQKDTLGNIYFETLNGLFSFNSEALQFSDYQLKISLDHLEINGEVDTVAQKTISSGNRIYLDWDQNFIKFQFANNETYSPTPLTFYYRIKGIHEKWINNNSSDFQLTGFSYGEYILEMKAVDTYGNTSNILALPFTIKSPFWLTAWFYSIILAIVGIIVFVWIKRREQKMKLQKEKLENTVQERTAEVVEKAQEIQDQKDVIEAKNIEMTDSIVYAERIQKAILPPRKQINQLLGDAFILYKPKDIVAGDFYWVEPSEDKKSVFFAAADCTGHGVPGAIVSVICNNALNRSLRELHLNSPAEILNATRDIVIHEFAKGKQEVQDGMDIALCKLTPKGDNYSLEYAGANNALIIVRPIENQPHLKVKTKNQAAIEIESNKKNEMHYLFEIKADKQPIGKYINEKNFTNHKVEILKGDIIYLFSDGYPDQFGSSDHTNSNNKNGKKLKTSNFKKMMLDMQNLSSKQQKEHLEHAFEKWRGDIEQIDDVCVLGVKL